MVFCLLYDLKYSEIDNKQIVSNITVQQKILNARQRLGSTGGGGLAASGTGPTPPYSSPQQHAPTTPTKSHSIFTSSPRLSRSPKLFSSNRTRSRSQGVEGRYTTNQNLNSSFINQPGPNTSIVSPTVPLPFSSQPRSARSSAGRKAGGRLSM